MTCACVSGLVGTAWGEAAAAPSIAEFAARPHILGASISPDGHYLAFIETVEGKAVAMVATRGAAAGPAPRVVLAEPKDFDMRWCRWATNTRLLCGFYGISTSRGLYPVSRLVAVDADAKNMRVLIQDSLQAQGQFQDRIVNWHPGIPDTVLIEADERFTEAELASATQIIGNVGTHAFPAVFALNVVTGALTLRQHAREPIRSWVTDVHGDVRLGYGFSGKTYSYYARLEGNGEWRRLAKFEAFTHENSFEPIAISADEPDRAYALGKIEGRKALWLIDLTDRQDPTLVFENPRGDVGSPFFAPDGRLLGVHYDTGYPLVYYTDPGTKELMRAVEGLYPGKIVDILDATSAADAYVLHTYSDIDAGGYVLLDTIANKASTIGVAYPKRDVSSLAPMVATSYAARDGKSIPAYLSLPRGVAPTHLPLIVLPHGGPIARDFWGYWFLREFLVSRGFAVLQMNFRGSGGYGDDWFYAAHQDWGGLTYDDVVDGTRWAIQQGVADPSRVCIVGWSFGGYLALLGAQRNGDLFRCAVDIAGPSDLAMLIDEGHHWIGSEVIKQQIGTDTEKLRRDSPRLHADEFRVPVLIVQGDQDWNVPIAQSEAIDAALKRAGKPHRFVVLPGADHQIAHEKDRATLLSEIDDFLGAQLAPGPGGTVAASP